MILVLISLPSDHVSFSVPQFSYEHSTGNNTDLLGMYGCGDVNCKHVGEERISCLVQAYLYVFY